MSQLHQMQMKTELASSEEVTQMVQQLDVTASSDANEAMILPLRRSNIKLLEQAEKIIKAANSLVAFCSSNIANERTAFFSSALTFKLQLLLRQRPTIYLMTLLYRMQTQPKLPLWKTYHKVSSK